jgi:hypothetical protein
LRKPTAPNGFPDGLLFADVYALGDRGFRIATVDASARFSIRTVRDGDCFDSPPVQIREGARIARVADTVFVVDREVQILERDRLRTLPDFTSVLAIDGPWVVAPAADARICVYRFPDLTRPVRELLYFRERIVCGCVSQILHCVAVATENGGVIVAGLEKGRSVVSFDIQNRAISGIWMTPSWGFIIVLHSGDERPFWALSVFSINGHFVRIAPLVEEPTAIAVWASAADFDYVAVASPSLVVAVTDAHELSLQKPILTFRANSRVLTMAFDVRARALIGVCVDGTVFAESCDVELSG